MGNPSVYGYGKGQLVPTYGYGKKKVEGGGSGDNGLIISPKIIKKTLEFDIISEIKHNQDGEFDISASILNKSIINFSIKSSHRLSDHMDFNVNSRVSQSISEQFDISASIHQRMDCEYDLKGKTDKSKMINLLRAM